MFEKKSAAKEPIKPWGLRDEIKRLFAIGGLLLVFGGVIVGTAWPGVEATWSYSLEQMTAEQTGSPGWTFVGVLIAAIGQICVAIAVIACGVHLANKYPVTRDAT